MNDHKSFKLFFLLYFKYLTRPKIMAWLVSHFTWKLFHNWVSDKSLIRVLVPWIIWVNFLILIHNNHKVLFSLPTPRISRNPHDFSQMIRIFHALLTVKETNLNIKVYFNILSSFHIYLFISSPTFIKLQQFSDNNKIEI